MAKLKTIPILAVLLWHHFCYYKRHKFALIFTILLPFLLVSMIYALSSMMKKHFTSSEPCIPDVEAMLAAGSLNFATSAACRIEKCLEENDKSQTRISIGYKRDFLHRDDCRFRGLFEKVDCFKQADHISEPNVVYCNIATSDIIYYPNTNKFVKQMMEETLSLSLQSHLDFICKSYKTRPLNRTLVKHIQHDRLQFIAQHIPNMTYDDTYLNFCLKSVKERIIGVDNYNEAIKWVRKSIEKTSINIYENNTAIPVPRFWAIVGFKSFETTTSTDVTNKNIEYDIVIDSATDSKVAKPSKLSLQSLVEESIILQLTGVAPDNLREPFIRLLPSKCWDRSSDGAYDIIGPLLCFIIIIGFILSPINALDQLVTEKLLHLREYLGTMGVSSAKIRLSWWIFYILFLLPLSIGVSVMIHYTPQNIFKNTDITLLIFLLILYNTSQLSQAFFLASVMTTTKRTGMMLVFLNVIFFLLSLILFSSLDNLRGHYLYAAYVLGLMHGAIPMTIACIYISSWENIWLGTYYYNTLLSPSLLDEYGGIAVAMIFLLLNSIIYMLLAWYIDAVFPGEFGLKRRPWFFVMPSYWIPSLNYSKQTKTSSAENTVANDAKPPSKDFPHNISGIQIKHLSKTYNNKTIGADNISIKLNKSEITALLGQNGAGKSTLINCVVGILQPTKGSIFIDSHPLIPHSKRHLIGYVPQHDILYPSLTLNEHICFYGALKGYTFGDAQSLVANDLKNLDLERVRTVIASQLSGGQKRKLSILTAYFGNPVAIVLDEPTAGIDPYSRRTIWELLLRNRIDTTTLLSTHSMQEADMLGDQIAIISSGCLVSHGTPNYLKNKYSCGMRLRIAMRSMKTEYLDKLNEFLQNAGIGNVVLEKNVGNDVTFIIPLYESRKRTFVHFLESFEAKQNELCFDSYGLSESSMEDVFFIATELHSEGKAVIPETLNEQNDIKNILGRKGKNISLLSSVKEVSKPSAEINTVASNFASLTTPICYTENEGMSSSILKILGLFEKRFLITIRSLHAIIRQMLVPLCFIGLSLIITANQRNDSDSIMTVHLWNQYSNNIFFHFYSGAETSQGVAKLVDQLKRIGPSTQCVNFQENYKKFPCSSEKRNAMPIDNSIKDVNKKSCSCNGYCNNAMARSIPHDRTKSNDVVFNLNSLKNTTYPIEKWIYEVNSSHFIVVGGFQFHRITDKRWENLNAKQPKQLNKIVKKTMRQKSVVIWTKPGMEYAMLNGFNNLQLRSIPKFDKYSIQLNLKQVKINPIFSEITNQLAEIMNLIYSCGFLIFAVFFSTFSIAIFVMSEKESGMKRFQRIYGVTILTDWLTNFFADLFFYAISIGMISLILYVAPNSFQDQVGEFLFLMTPYGLMVIWHFYMLSFVFETLTGLTKFYIITSLMLTFAAIILNLLKLTDLSQDDDKSQHNWIKYIVPIIAILPQFFLPESLFFLSSLTIISQWLGHERIFDSMYQFDALGQYLLIAVLASVAFMCIIFILERLNIDCASLCLCCKTFNKIDKNPNVQLPKISYIVELANDVKNEEQKVVSQPPGEDPLEVRMLKKIYPNASVPSVDGVTFSVPQKQCFGLLGVNGAGKTTIFRILTGFLKPSSGTTMINGSDLYNVNKKASISFSYCPQDNMLFDELSVFQHLTFYAKLRNMPSATRKELIFSIMEDLDLAKYRKTKSCNLSGGNKRKLQLAISIIGYPSLIFLDEPTTGMDPGARRRAWRMIESAIEKGSSVVLTTHSMEECEALCHRLTIMVRGQMMCLGSIQSLKNKFGNRYTIILRLTKDCQEDKSQASAENRETVVNNALATNVRAENLVLLKQIVAEQCPTAIVIEEQLVLLNYEISVNDIQLSKLFSIMFELKDRLPSVIEDFTVSQLSLEQVFANLVQMYEMIVPEALPNSPQNTNITGSDIEKHHADPNYQQNFPIESQKNLQPISGNTEKLLRPLSDVGKQVHP